MIADNASILVFMFCMFLVSIYIIYRIIRDRP